MNVDAFRGLSRIKNKNCLAGISQLACVICIQYAKQACHMLMSSEMQTIPMWKMFTPLISGQLWL